MPKPIAALAFALCGVAQTSFAQTLPSEIDPSFSFMNTDQVFRFEPSLQTSAGLIYDGIRTVDDDLLGIARLPLDYPQTFAIAAAGIGALMLADVPVTTAYQETVESALSGFAIPDLELPWSAPLEDLGLTYEDVYVVSAVTGLYAWGVASGNEQHQRAAILTSKAITYSFLTTQVVLKTIFGRNRPYDDLATAVDDPDSPRTLDPFDFGNSGGIALKPTQIGTAFPSFHFTFYAATAHTLSGVYDDAIWPYLAMGVVGASRIEGHNHWVSDMVAGTLLGIGIGEVVLRNDEALRIGEFQALPSVTQNGVGLTLTRSF